ncbi:hypothetical protein ACTOB_005901 [Actinoplanes oblitus]|uniref:Uncharacterized protein n=1 Tax=Actinoplanes oblitus TaxID=3040509 RepID=A0ABY8W8T6_9ACTN|nr:hypothetical protein [Actinoplanes oblitus]WIM93907.1 hypothetical protein ACTOB_005901 [Actinoplanes oblitus]
MVTKDILTSVTPLIVPLVTMIATTLGIVLQDWRSRRNRLLRRRMLMDEATKQVAFVSEWWKASQLVDDPARQEAARAAAAAMIAEAATRVAEVPVVAPKPRTRSLIRRLLLWYPFSRRTAEVIRVLYYALLALMTHGVGNFIQDNLDDQYDDYVRADFIALGVLGVLAASIRFWAVRVEESGGEARRGRRSTVGQWLLLYRIRTPRARVIKAGFFLMIGGIAWYVWHAVGWVEDEPLRLFPEASFIATLLACAMALSAWARSIDPGTADERPGPVRGPLLLFRMRRGSARFVRLLTYAGAIIATVLVLVGVPEKPFAWGDPEWMDLIGAAAGLLMIVAALRYWAVTIDQGGLPDEPGSFRRFALLYPFPRRAARVVRAGFFVATVLAAGDLVSLALHVGDLADQAGAALQTLVEAGLAAGLRAWALALHGPPAQAADRTALIAPRSAAPGGPG